MAHLGFQIDEVQDLVCKEVAVQILLLDPFNLVIDDLEDLVCHDEVILLPDIDQMLPFDDHLVAVCVQIHLNHLEPVVSRLHNIVHVEANPLKDARQLEDGVVKELLG